MIKLVYIIRRHPDFSQEDFYKRWLSHGPLVGEVAEAINARRYIQSHTIDTPLNEQFAQSRDMGKAYDGITEVWWDSLEDLVAGMNTPEGQAAHKRLLEDEREFIDLANSRIFLTEEHQIFARS
ncbi:MAG: EthD domain-containing protein [bacterium]|nr:EthD domain-containing protein [bacterium]